MTFVSNSIVGHEIMRRLLLKIGCSTNHENTVSLLLIGVGIMMSVVCIGGDEIVILNIIAIVIIIVIQRGILMTSFECVV